MRTAAPPRGIKQLRRSSGHDASLDYRNRLARSKVHVYTTLFSNYMEVVHPYEEPVPPPPFCAFKFYFEQFEALRDACALFPDAVEYFGAFEFDKPGIARRIASCPEDFEKKTKYQTGADIFVVILRRINEETFLSFASIQPYFVTEDNDQAQAMMDEYFPEGAEDMILEDLIEDDVFSDEEEMEDEEDYEEELKDQTENEDAFATYSYL